MNQQSTKKRILCLWLPNWSIQRIAVAQPDLKNQLTTLYKQDARRGQLVTACSAAARQRGIKVGMLLSEAKSLIKQASQKNSTKITPSQTPRSFFIHHDPERDLEALESLADECEIFSPIVGLEQAEQPNCIYLDITGLKQLFQGEKNLGEQILEYFSTLGYWPCISIAHTIGLAWGFKNEAFRKEDSRSGSRNYSSANNTTATTSKRIAIFPEVNHWHEIVQHPEFTRLPINCLRIPDSTISTLHQLGIVRMQQLLQLPRTSLASRLGTDLIQRLDQATGRRHEVIVARHKPPHFQTEFLIDHPSCHPETIKTVIRSELTKICIVLQQHQKGALQIHCRLLCDSENQQDGDNDKKKFISIRIGLFQPTAISSHLVELIQMQLEQLHLPGNVHEVRISIPQSSLLIQKQKRLFDDNPRDDPILLAQLVNRLGVRLGEDKVLGFSVCPGNQPELDFRYYRLASHPRLKRRKQKRTDTKKQKSNNIAIPSPFQERTPSKQDQWKKRPWQSPRPLDRPPRMLPKPVQLQAFSTTDGPPALFLWRGIRQKVATCWGPERIQTGWWQGIMAERDYWQIETENGSRFWIFRDLRKKQWYIHGTF